MRILCVIPSYWPAFQLGGPIFSVHNLNKELVKRGLEVVVYTTNFGLESSFKINQEICLEGVRVHYFNFVKFFEWIGTTGWQFSLPLTQALKENVKKFDVVYIVAVWNYPVAIAAYYSRLYKKPYIISPRGLLYPYGLKRKSWQKILYYQLIIKRYLQNAAAIHYTSQDELEKCHFFWGLKNKTSVIPNGIDISEFSILPDKDRLRQIYPHLKDKKLIIFLGRLNYKKGLDILLKAFSLLSQTRRDLHLLIAGNDEAGYIRKVQRWIKDYALENKVTLTGMILGQEKLNFLCGSNIFVLPSYSENFGMSVIEAMACKLPVVISNQIGIHKEISQAKAGLVINTNDKELKEALDYLLENPSLCRLMGENARKLVEEKFSLDKIVDGVVAMFKEGIR